jgi:hypothetical protein
VVQTSELFSALSGEGDFELKDSLQSSQTKCRRRGKATKMMCQDVADLPLRLCAWPTSRLCSLFLACSAFRLPRSFFHQFASAPFLRYPFLSSRSSLAPHSLLPRRTALLSPPSYPLHRSHPSPIERSAHGRYVLHSDYHLGSTNLPQTSKRARSTSTTSVPFLHRCPLSSPAFLSPRL